MVDAAKSFKFLDTLRYATGTGCRQSEIKPYLKVTVAWVYVHLWHA